jgi:hypothetical protein
MNKRTKPARTAEPIAIWMIHGVVADDGVTCVFGVISTSCARTVSTARILSAAIWRAEYDLAYNPFMAHSPFR